MVVYKVVYIDARGCVDACLEGCVVGCIEVCKDGWMCFHQGLLHCCPNNKPLTVFVVMGQQEIFLLKVNQCALLKIISRAERDIPFFNHFVQ